MLIELAAVGLAVATALMIVGCVTVSTQVQQRESQAGQVRDVRADEQRQDDEQRPDNAAEVEAKMPGLP